ncbi:hypothetical protein KC852_03355 [Candidatus Nomurabacteria bacterium]|nr:hypothetical protein [Candidatus Nomurabacteria bacterium]
MRKVNYKEVLFVILGAAILLFAIPYKPAESPVHGRPTTNISDYEETVNEILSVVTLSAEINEPVGTLFEEYYATHSSASMSDIQMKLLDQARRRFDGAGVALKIPTVDGVSLYSMQGGEGYGGYFWVLWLSQDKKDNLYGNPDITINFPVEDPSVLMVRTEKFVVDGEDEPLVRGYLIEDGFAKPTVGLSPVFVEYK